MTTPSGELLELCKQVYEATGWKQSPNISQLYEYWDDHDELCVISIEDADDALVPAYASDYLLEKLPNGTTILKDVHGFKAWNIYNRKRIATYTCDSPVEALLKLTLKLHEEKML